MKEKLVKHFKAEDF